MRTAHWTMVSGLALLGACGCAAAETAERAEPPPARLVAAPSADAAERHAALTFTIGDDRTRIQAVRVGGGPARGYARGNKPIRIDLLDRNGDPFDQVVIDDPRQLRAYDGGAPAGSSPHGMVELREADATIVLPLDPRLHAILVKIGARDRGTPLAVGDAIAEQCGRDRSDACETFRRSR